MNLGLNVYFWPCKQELTKQSPLKVCWLLSWSFQSYLPIIVSRWSLPMNCLMISFLCSNSILNSSFVFSIGVEGARSLQWWNHILHSESFSVDVYLRQQDLDMSNPQWVQHPPESCLKPCLREREILNLYLWTRSLIQRASRRGRIWLAGWDLHILMPLLWMTLSRDQRESGARPRLASPRAAGHLQPPLASLSIQEGCSLVIFSY